MEQLTFDLFPDKIFAKTLPRKRVMSSERQHRPKIDIAKTKHCLFKYMWHTKQKAFKTIIFHHIKDGCE